MENFDRKQEQARSELYDMYARAMPPVPPFVRLGGDEQRKPQEAPLQKGEKAPPPPKKGKGLLGLDILKIFNEKGLELDSDRILILALILLLSGDNSDEILIFALCYLML